MPGIGSSGEKTNFRTLAGILGLKGEGRVKRVLGWRGFAVGLRREGGIGGRRSLRCYLSRHFRPSFVIPAKAGNH